MLCCVVFGYPSGPSSSSSRLPCFYVLVVGGVICPSPGRRGIGVELPRLDSSRNTLWPNHK
jgi:hypothetical protein